MLHLSSTLLKEEMTKAIELIGVNLESAKWMIDSVIITSLRGTDSHGINLFPHYWNVLQTGRINKNPQMKFDKKKSSIGIIDANFALGHHAGVVAAENATRLAAESGSGFVVVKNSTHFGAAAYFGLIPARSGMIGMAFTNADALVKVENAKAAFFGTNPICITAPLESEEPLCLDMATSQVSWNKIRNYRASNQPLPAGWAFNANGLSETDPHLATSLNPSGGYKGFGLGMMVEVLCGILAQGPVGTEIGAMFVDLKKRRSLSHFFGAIDVSQFLSLKDFKSRLQQVVHSIRNLAPSGDLPVMVPGDPEKKSYEKRLKAGIPMEESRFEEFLKISSSFNRALIS